jgi:hypothetical protein
MLDHLAEKFRQLEGQTSSKAKEVGERNEPMKEAAEKLLDEQQKLDRRLERVEKALQRDANAQNMTGRKGRERARDGDAGRESVRKPADAAKEALEKGVETGNAAEQQKALGEAAQKQGKVAEALDLLAEHFRNLEAGDPEAIARTRKKLRDAEEELGIKKDLDEQFGMIERLMDMAKKKPEDSIKELEEALKNDPAMQDELRDIADEAAENAKNEIGKTAEEQKDFANELDPWGHVADTAREIVREDIPLIEEKSKAGNVDAQKELDQAKKALEKAASSAEQAGDNPGNPSVQQKALKEVFKELGKAVKKLEEAAGKAKVAADKAVNPEDKKAAEAAKKKAEAAKKKAEAAKKKAEAAKKKAEATKEKAEAFQKNGEVADGKPVVSLIDDQKSYKFWYILKNLTKSSEEERQRARNFMKALNDKLTEKQKKEAIRQAKIDIGQFEVNK